VALATSRNAPAAIEPMKDRGLRHFDILRVLSR
jgi:hypothetical protein